MLKLGTKRITLLITIFVAILAYLVPERVGVVNALLSANTTRIREATKLSTGALLAIGVILAGIFVYLWIDAGKEDKTDILIREMKLLNRKTGRIEKKLRIRKVKNNVSKK